MEYLVKVNSANKEYKDMHKGKWNVLTEKEMLARYPSGGFKVIGDLIDKKEKGYDVIVLGEQKHTIKEYVGQLNHREYVYGYIELDVEDGFVRVIKKKKSYIFLLCILLLLICSIFFAGIWLGQKEEEPYLDDTAIAYHIEGFENTDPSQILLPGIDEIYVQENETEVEYVLFNPTGNMCNIVYTIKLEETGEVLYTSKQVKPGYAITKFTLNRTFEKGEYDIAVQMTTYSSEDYETRYNSGVMDAKLIVE